MEYVIVDQFDELVELAKKHPNTIGDGDPKKGESFCLWRGVNNSEYELMASLQHRLRDKYGEKWRSIVKRCERNRVDKFVTTVMPNVKELWTASSTQDGPRASETVWHLSVMQHYGCPTRFVDFSACFWTAIFFAAHGANGYHDLGLYRLDCINSDESNIGGNKLPRDSKNEPWKVGNDVDIHDFLGHVIGYGCYAKNAQDMSTWTSPVQGYGWDRPWIKDARIRKQKAFFVYTVDVTRTLGEVLEEDNGKHDEKVLTAYKINRRLLPEIQSVLEERKMKHWIICLDLEEVFREWPYCDVPAHGWTMNTFCKQMRIIFRRLLPG